MLRVIKGVLFFLHTVTTIHLYFLSDQLPGSNQLTPVAITSILIALGVELALDLYNIRRTPGAYILLHFVGIWILNLVLIEQWHATAIFYAQLFSTIPMFLADVTHAIALVLSTRPRFVE